MLCRLSDHRSAVLTAASLYHYALLSIYSAPAHWSGFGMLLSAALSTLATAVISAVRLSLIKRCHHLLCLTYLADEHCLGSSSISSGADYLEKNWRAGTRAGSGMLSRGSLSALHSPDVPQLPGLRMGALAQALTVQLCAGILLPVGAAYLAERHLCARFLLCSGDG